MIKDNQPELLTVVDDNNQIIGQEIREAVKQKGLHSRCVHIFIFNKEGKMLVCHRPKTKFPYPDTDTASAGGNVRAGESYLDTAKRELKEELGIATELKYVGDFINIGEHNKKEFHQLFTGQHDGPFQFEEREVKEWRFADPKLLKKEMAKNPDEFAPSFRLSFQLYCDKNNL